MTIEAIATFLFLQCSGGHKGYTKESRLECMMSVQNCAFDLKMELKDSKTVDKCVINGQKLFRRDLNGRFE